MKKTKLFVVIDTETGSIWQGYKGRIAYQGRGSASGAWTTANYYKTKTKFREQSRYQVKEIDLVFGPKTRLEVNEVQVKNG
jgi:hypothetical protein